MQINGKIKSSHQHCADISKEDAIAAGKAAVADKLTGTIVKRDLCEEDHKYRNEVI